MENRPDPIRREQRIRTECARRGLKIERFGQAWRIHGHGVDVLAATVQDFFESDLEPCV